MGGGGADGCLLCLQLRELLSWYTATFKDALMAQRPAWVQAFIYCEVFLQLPFFPLAAYAFYRGQCSSSSLQARFRSQVCSAQAAEVPPSPPLPQAWEMACAFREPISCFGLENSLSQSSYLLQYFSEN